MNPEILKARSELDLVQYIGILEEYICKQTYKEKEYIITKASLDKPIRDYDLEKIFPNIVYKKCIYSDKEQEAIIKINNFNQLLCLIKHVNRLIIDEDEITIYDDYVE